MYCRKSRDSLREKFGNYEIADHADEADMIFKQKEAKRAKIGFGANAYFFGDACSEGN
jgi:hypothetical protein